MNNSVLYELMKCGAQIVVCWNIILIQTQHFKELCYHISDVSDVGIGVTLHIVRFLWSVPRIKLLNISESTSDCVNLFTILKKSIINFTIERVVLRIKKNIVQLTIETI